MGKKLRILGFLASLFVFVFSTNAFAIDDTAPGYMCEVQYTECVTNRFLYNGKCESCPEHSSKTGMNNSTTCTCDSGYWNASDHTTTSVGHGQTCEVSAVTVTINKNGATDITIDDVQNGDYSEIQNDDDIFKFTCTPGTSITFTDIDKENATFLGFFEQNNTTSTQWSPTTCPDTNKTYYMMWSCNAGSYEKDNSCVSCPAGTYSTTTGATSYNTCLACPPSSYSTAGATTCNLCNAGQTTAGPGADTCIDCSDYNSLASENAYSYVAPEWENNEPNGIVINICKIDKCKVGSVRTSVDPANNTLWPYICAPCTGDSSNPGVKSCTPQAITDAPNNDNTCSYTVTENPGYTVDTPQSSNAGVYQYICTAEANSFTVTYYGNGNTGGTVPSDQTCYYGQTCTVSRYTPTRDNYNFAGWDISCSGCNGSLSPNHVGAGGDITNITTADRAEITLTATWTPTAEACSDEQYFDSTTSSCRPCPSGYTTRDDSQKNGESACWQSCTRTCSGRAACPANATCTYNESYSTSGKLYYNNGTCTAPNPGVCPVDTATPCTACANNDSVDCELYVENNTCKYTTSCKTGFENIKNSGQPGATCPAIAYTITYNMNDGSWPNSATHPDTYHINDADFTITNPTRTGWTFTGWTVTTAPVNWGTGSSTNGGTNLKIATGTYGNIALSANWSANSYTVTYDLNAENAGGTKPADQTCSVGTICNLASGDTTDFYYAGYVFQGWSTTRNGSPISSLPVTQTTDIPVYAIWAPCTPGSWKGGNGIKANAACAPCPDGYQNTDGSGTSAITSCYSDTKYRESTGAHNEPSVTGCYQVTYSDCTPTPCEYTAYSNDSGTGEGEWRSGCTTNTATCTKDVISPVYADAGYFAPIGATSCTSCAAINSVYPLSDRDTTDQGDCYRLCEPNDVQHSAEVEGRVKASNGSTSGCRAKQCLPNYYLKDGQCLSCPTNAECDGGTSTFECLPGYEINSTGDGCVGKTYNITLEPNRGTDNGTDGQTSVVATFGSPMPKLSSLATRDTYSLTGYFDAETGGIQYYTSDGESARNWDQHAEQSYVLYAQWSQNSVSCELGQYYDGTTMQPCESGWYCPGTGTAVAGGVGCRVSCSTLGDEYTGSVPESTSSDTCYKECDSAPCIVGTSPSDCPQTPKAANSCTFKSWETVSGVMYYNTSTCLNVTDTMCPYDNIYCPLKHYLKEDHCEKCPTTHPLSNNNNFTNISVCYTTCELPCTKAECPDYATCDYDWSPVCYTDTTVDYCIQGKQFYGSDCNAGGTCNMNITCYPGYDFDSSTATCNPGTYTITLTDSKNNTKSYIYEKYSVGWYSDDTATQGTEINSITVPTFSNWNFAGYYTEESGGDKIITEDGRIDVSNKRFTDDTVLYAHWSQGWFTCTEGKNASGEQCPQGFYCPGGNVESGQEGTVDTGCVKTCPKDLDGKQGTTMAGGKSSINDCYVLYNPFEVTPNYPNHTWTKGTGWVEAYYVGTQESGDYTKYYKAGALTCDAGYYYTGSTVMCSGVESCHYSPEQSEFAGETPTKQNPGSSTIPVPCPAGCSGSEQYAYSYTQCYKACNLGLSDFEHSKTVVPASLTVTGASKDTYNECLYTLTCDPGYKPQGNGTAAPSCQAKEYTITLNKNGGAGATPENIQCTFGSRACELPAIVDTRDGYSTARKWCTAADGTGTCYDAGTTVTTDISANGDNVELFAQWTPNVYTITLDHNGAVTAGAPATVYLKYATGWYSDAAATTPITQLTTLPEKTGYVFAGYGNNPEIITTAGAFVTAQDALSFTTTDTTVLANWSAGNTQCPEGTYYKGRDTTCLPCNKDHYCPGGEYPTDGGERGQIVCPDGGKAPTESKKASDCYKENLPTYQTDYGRGTQTCYYKEDTRSYSGPCKDYYITYCNRGYWLDTTLTPRPEDCAPAGPGYYSAESELEHHKCPNGGTTAENNETAESAYDCYKTGLDYIPTNLSGSGKQSCWYSSGDGDSAVYERDCFDEVIDKCHGGYYLANSTDIVCSKVGPDHYSDEGDIERHPCPENGKTNGTMTADIGLCYKDGLDYRKDHGGGSQTCNWDDNVESYSMTCGNTQITYCYGGYWLDLTKLRDDCVAVGYNAYSPYGDIKKYDCQPGEITLTETSASASDCFSCPENHVCNTEIGDKTCSELTGGRYTLSDAGSDDKKYCYRKCDLAANATVMDGRDYNDAGDVPDTCKIKTCAPGYYLDGDRCVECPAGSVCNPDIPGNGKKTCSELTSGQYTMSDSKTSDIAYCYRDCALAQNANSMSGQDYYNAPDTCEINTCMAGYYLDNGQCVKCPAGSVCNPDIPGNGKKTCSELTGGRFTLSDAGSDDEKYCYRECDLAANATTMDGRDYNDAGDEPDTCEIKICAAGYTLSNGQCVPCPANSYCDGTPGDDGDGAESCADLGDGSWAYSDGGATATTDCYKTCSQYVEGACTLTPVNNTVHWPNNCEYTGTSATGNPAEVVDGVCVETECNSDYEMINGVCEPCNREHALAYKADGNCVVRSCESGYHPNGDKCEADVIDCTPKAPNAAYAEQKWIASRGAFDICIIHSCMDDFHLVTATNTCEPNTQPCAVTNGTGTKTWNTRTNSWNACEATSCAPGFTNDPYEKNKASEQCSDCRNKFNYLGELVASSYTTGCEIASCMYQGEKYKLDNNECVLICDPSKSDETGTIRWDPSTEKCERTCTDGYISW